MPDPLRRDPYLSHIKFGQGFLLFTPPSITPKLNSCPQLPSSAEPLWGWMKQKSNTILTAGDVGGPSGLSLWFPSGGLQFRGVRESLFNHPPNFKTDKAQPHPSTHLQTSPPTATSLLKTGDTFLPTYHSYSPLRSWSPILKGTKFGVHPSHLGCRRKEPPQSHRWPPSSRLAQGVGSALGRGDPHKRAQEGVPPLPVRIGDTPPKPVPAHPSPTRRERQLQCPSQIPPTLHSSPHLEGSRGPQKIPKKSRMLAGRSWTSSPNLGSSDPPVFSGKFRLSPASRQPCSVPMPILEVTPSFLLPSLQAPPLGG